MRNKTDLNKMHIFSSKVDNSNTTLNTEDISVKIADTAHERIENHDIRTRAQKIYDLLSEHYDENLMKYINPNMSPQLLVCYEEAYRLHPSNVKRLSELNFDEEKSCQMLKSFRHHIDLAEEIEMGVTEDELDALLTAVDKGCKLQDIFTEDGAYVNYSYLLEKFGKK